MNFVENCPHQMPYFTANVYKIQFRLRVVPNSMVGELTALPQNP